MLFHYHFWTPHLEETEKFYVENGFRVTLRLGKHEGEFQSFNPPLNWDDFRQHTILFRIIEVRKGAINLTFGYGKRVMFDHIGFLVSEEKLNRICDYAEKMNWPVDRGDRRTFITTPYKFRIELQANMDAIDSLSEKISLKSLKVETNKPGLENDLLALFGQPVPSIHNILGEAVTIKEAVMEGMQDILIDPNGVKIIPNGSES
ncbi:hypothetical protein LC048_11055 [Mesobacillus subterraneus]|uniref:hypothetical protein n=1 Tax=Mesobacillus subterraneus TaxID=285983 RepID=UPI001CFEFAD9|nr:hypothetical protein [Mesobacillus subterraneus]WLR57342.1 hypothetical protein LC048_11055 [Mesobacillus subterraneus]